MKILDGIVSAAQNFEHAKLPEVFAGFSQKDFSIPVRYPVACHPQAWAAGSVPFMLSSLLGLTADAFNRKLRVIRPALPDSVKELEFRRIRIGGSTVDLHVRRTMQGEVHVEVSHNDGSVLIEQEHSPAG
jgi:glycogen debranching enzyme